MYEKILKYVEELFKDKVDKGGHPYIGHLKRVALGVDTEEEKILALLHDVLEDTDKNEEDLKELGLNDKQIEVLRLLTRTKDLTYNEYINKIIESKNVIALKIKLSDLLDNSNLKRLKNITKKDIDRVEKRYKPSIVKVKKALSCI